MKLKTVIRSVLAMLCFALPSAVAQVSINTNLTTGTMTSNVANLYRSAYLHFQLVNCGDNIPVVPGQPNAVVQDSFDLRPSTPGSAIVGQILGNDQITCGNVISTYYEVTAMKDASHPLRDGIPYVICSASAGINTCGNGNSLGSFNLVTADPMSQPPPVPGFVELYGNPTNNQTINQPPGTQFNGIGAFLFNQGIFSGPIFFSQLPSLVGLTNIVYVQDGTFGSNPCTGGGTGAFAFYVDGVWTCSLGGGSSGGSNFSGSVGRIPLFNSSTGGGNSCLADSNTGSGGSIFNGCGTENFNLSSFQTVTYPATVGLNNLTATSASIGTLNINSFVLNGPAAIISPCTSVAPQNPGSGHAELAILPTNCLFGEFPGGGTAFYPFPMQYANFPTGGNVSASGTNTLFGDVSYIDAVAPGYAGSDNCASIIAAENANTTYAPDVDARGFQGLVPCANAAITSLFSSSYQGSLTLGPVQLKPANGIGIPRKSMLHGAGWQTGSGQPYVGATVIQANNIPTNTPLMGFTCDGVTFNFNCGPVFDSPVDEITLDCQSVAGCIGFADYVGQEGAGLFRSNILGFGNGGIGLNIGGADVAVTPGTPTNTYGQAVPCSSASCPITLANPQANGDLIAICARWTPYTVTLTGASNSTTHDSYTTVSNTAVVDGTLEGGGCIWDNNVNAGTGTIGLTFSGSVNSNTLYVAAIEVPNINNVDIASAAVSTTHGPGPSVVTTNTNKFNPDDMIVGVALTATNSSSWAPGSGFTSGIATGNVGLEYQTQATTGTYASTWVSTNTAHTLMFTMAFTSGTNNNAGGQNGWFDGLDFSLSSGTTITRTAKCINQNTGTPGSAGPKHINSTTCTAQGASATSPYVLESYGGGHETLMDHHGENSSVAYMSLGFDEGANSIDIINLNGGNMNAPLSYTVTGASQSGNTATYTTSAPCTGLNAGQPITITGITPSGYNQTSSQAVPFTVFTSCAGSTFTAVTTAGSLSTATGQSGTVTVQNSLLKISANNPNSTGGICGINVSDAGPNFAALLLSDEMNQNYIPTSAESYLSLYCIGAPGSIWSGASNAEAVVTTSGVAKTHLWNATLQLESDDYDVASQFGDIQAGGATQYPAKHGYSTIPVGATYMTVSTNAIQSATSHVFLVSDIAHVALFGGSPSNCNPVTTAVHPLQLVAIQPPFAAPTPNTANGYPASAVTSSSLSTHSMTITLPSTTAFAVGNIVRYAGATPSTSNSIGWISSVTTTSSTAIVYQTYSATGTTSTGGTLQIIPGFVVGTSATIASTYPECFGFKVED